METGMEDTAVTSLAFQNESTDSTLYPTEDMNTALTTIFTVGPFLLLIWCLYKWLKSCGQRPVEEEREAENGLESGQSQQVSSISRRLPFFNRQYHYRHLPTTNPEDTNTSGSWWPFFSQFRREDTESVEPETVEVNVIEVPDGDGVKAFNVDANEIFDVRLIGIDAPEIGQPLAIEAKRHLERLVLHKSAVLTKYNLDQYERVLGNLRVPGEVENVSLEMLKTGLACVYAGRGAEYGGKRAEFYRAQNLAKKQKLGIWALKNLVLPGEFKRRQRSRSRPRSLSP